MEIIFQQKNSTYLLSYINLQHPPQSNMFNSSFELLGRTLLWQLLWPCHTIICVAFKGLKGICTEMGIFCIGWQVIHTGIIQVADFMSTENLLWPNYWFQSHYQEILSCQYSRFYQTYTICKLTSVWTWDQNAIMLILIEINCLVDWSYQACSSSGFIPTGVEKARNLLGCHVVRAMPWFKSMVL